MSRTPLIAILISTIVIFHSSSAAAHRMNVFAVWDGAGLTGSVYFTGGGKGSGLSVEVIDPDGELVTQVVTDDKGAFRIAASEVTKFLGKTVTVQCDSGEGHIASIGVYIGEPDGTTMEKPTDLPDSSLGLRQYIGAIGIVFGIFGLLYWVMAKRRR